MAKDLHQLFVLPVDSIVENLSRTSKLMGARIDQRSKLPLLVPVSLKRIDVKQLAIERHTTLGSNVRCVVKEFANRVRIIVLDAVSPQSVIVSATISQRLSRFLKERFVLHTKGDFSWIDALDIFTFKKLEHIFVAAVLRNVLPGFFVNGCRFINDVEIAAFSYGKDFDVAGNMGRVVREFSSGWKVKRILNFLRAESVELHRN